ncbi:unnamed protein product [Closterium sp. Naga37s-1]|nr:unnamed protein product [Closterium sp. Naga37s-1]
MCWGQQLHWGGTMVLLCAGAAGRVVLHMTDALGALVNQGRGDEGDRGVLCQMLATAPPSCTGSLGSHVLSIQGASARVGRLTSCLAVACVCVGWNTHTRVHAGSLWHTYRSGWGAHHECIEGRLPLQEQVRVVLHHVYLRHCTTWMGA